MRIAGCVRERKRERATYGFPLPFEIPHFSLTPDSRSKKDSLGAA